jgi:hypothetical protein
MSLLTRLINALNPQRLDEDLAEETRDHLERRSAELPSRLRVLPGHRGRGFSLQPGESVACRSRIRSAQRGVLNITSDAADKSDDPVFWNSSHADQEALLGKRMLRLQFAVASQPGIQDAAVAVPATSFTG